MTYDPREKKLPKWAQELITSERVKSDLAWPSVPRPEPVATFDYNGFSYPRADLEGGYWRVVKGYSAPYAEEVYFKRRYVYSHPDCSSFGSRPKGRFYSSKEDACAAAWWLACEMAAKSIHTAAQNHRESAV